MVNPRREGFGEEAKRNESDRFDRHQESDVFDEPSEIDESEPLRESADTRNNGGLSSAFPGRIRDVLRDGADFNSLLGREEVEYGILQWIHALGLQFFGGCRADERLKPLLKLNASTGAADGQFMAQLVQHFEAAEVAVLARCLCLPLVSVRVGKINKQGSMLYPTASRGFLSLTLLPSSHMRVSFTGDDGCIKKLALISNDLESPSVIIEDISSDTSGRSFLLRFPGSQILYFWCSEKSKADGMGLVMKMKDLLVRKPSLTDLSGISKSRLDSFAAHLWAYILSSSSSAPLTTTSSEANMDRFCQPNSSHSRLSASHAGKAHPVHQTILNNQRSNAFKDGVLPRSIVHEKVDSFTPSFAFIPSSSSLSLNYQLTSSTEGGNAEKKGSFDVTLSASSSFSSPLFSLSPAAFGSVPTQFGSQGSLFSPNYCWCPPFPNPLQRYGAAPHLASGVSQSSSPPLSPLFPPLLSHAESLISSKYPLNASDLSLAIPPLCPLPSSQQIATFTPFMSDPIVHIPVIDFCSSGQGYLVSAGASLSTAIPPLPISHASHHHRHQLIPPSESPAEKSARETLRMLMASAPALTPPKLFNVLPEVLGRMELCGTAPRSDLLFETKSAASSSLDLSLSSTCDTTSCAAAEETFSEGMQGGCSCSDGSNCRTFDDDLDAI